MNITANIKIYY